MPKSTDSVINRLNALNLCSIRLTNSINDNMSYHFLVKDHVAIVVCGTSFIAYNINDPALIKDYEVKQDDKYNRPYMLKATEKLLDSFTECERSFMTTKAAIMDCCENGMEYDTPMYIRKTHKIFQVGKGTVSVNARIMKKYLPFFNSRTPVKVSIFHNDRFVFSQNDIYVCINGFHHLSDIILEK